MKLKLKKCGFQSFFIVHKLPLLNDCLASMECTIKEAYEGGDHTIFVGQIENGDFDEESDPLIYYKSGLGDFKPN